MLKISLHNRQTYYAASIVIIVLSVVYCSLVYMSGSPAVDNSGYLFLMGIPNYYFFYLAILPFITAGIVFLAINNTNIRFFGELNKNISDERRAKLLRYRRILLVVAVIFSVAVTLNDAMEKGRTLPPYSIEFSAMTPGSYPEVVEKYFLLKDDLEEGAEGVYLKYLQARGFSGASITGFDSISSWYAGSSFIYKMESFLSWVAALIISLFFSQIFLLVIAKDYVLPESKDLILWLTILCSFWIPTKIFSVYYYSLVEYEPPGIVWFAIFLLAIGVILALFIKVEKNDMNKYANYIAGVASAAVSIVGFYHPEYFKQVFIVADKLGWLYGGIILFVVGMTIYLMTDHMIQCYEKSKLDTPDNTVRNNNTVKPA